MSLSGPQALQSLDDAIRDIRRQESELTKKLGRSAERLGKLRETEAGLFLQLANVRLSPQVRENLSGRLIAAEERAHEMIAGHIQALEDAEVAVKQADDDVAEKALARRDIISRLDAAQEKLAKLSKQIGTEIAGDPIYKAQQEKADSLSQIAAQSFAKTEQAEIDRDEKGKPYRDDPLFMYLWEAGYATRNYRANNLVRWFDGMVARMVRYHDARPNFAMLNDIPLRLREHAERQIAAAETAEEELLALEDTAIDTAGGKPMREAIEHASKDLEQFDIEMAALEDHRDDKARALRKLVEGNDSSFEEANSILALALGQQDIQGLLDAARQTRTEADDALVNQIRNTRVRIGEDEAEAKDDKARLKTFASRRQELEEIEWEFKKARFDDPRSVFKEDNLAGDLLGEFLRGAITAASYWDHWQRSQSWRPGTSDWGKNIGLPRQRRHSNTPWPKSGGNGGFSWPSSSGSSRSSRGSFGGSGGGFSRPRTGSRGSRRSGGFKTGGGF